MNKTLSWSVIGSVLLILIFHKYIPIRNYQFWPMLVLFFASSMIFFEWVFDVKHAQPNTEYQWYAVGLIVIWFLCVVTYMNAGLYREAVFNAISFFIFAGVFVMTKFFQAVQSDLS